MSHAHFIASAVFAVMLAFASGVYAANWDKLYEDQDQDFSIDWNSIESSGNLRTAWFLIKFKKRQCKNDICFTANRQQLEFDCQKKTSRTLYMSLTDERNGAGPQVLAFSKPQLAQPVIPDSLNEANMIGLCSR